MEDMITKLVLPVAGKGTRLRPLTLTTPKNLISVGGRPLLEYVLDEAVAAEIKEVILVVSPEHQERYAAYLRETAINKYPQLGFHLRLQEKPWGHGHAVLQAADVIAGEPFLVRFCDDLILGEESVLRGLSRIFETYRSPVLLLARVPEAEICRYGAVAAKEIQTQPRLHRIFRIVEKPKTPEEAPSNLAAVGAYALPPEIIVALKRLAEKMRRKNDALLIYAPILEMLAAGKPVYGWEFNGQRLDCGTLDGLKLAEERLRSV